MFSFLKKKPVQQPDVVEEPVDAVEPKPDKHFYGFSSYGDQPHLGAAREAYEDVNNRRDSFEPNYQPWHYCPVAKHADLSSKYVIAKVHGQYAIFTRRESRRPLMAPHEFAISWENPDRIEWGDILEKFDDAMVQNYVKYLHSIAGDILLDYNRGRDYYTTYDRATIALKEVVKERSMKDFKIACFDAEGNLIPNK